MYMDYIKLLKNENEIKTLIQEVRLYNQDITMKFGIENIRCL